MAAIINSVFNASVTTVVNVTTTANPKVAAIVLLNTVAAVTYFQIFNLPAASVVLGATAPVAVIGIPASGGLSFPLGDGWHVAGTGLSVAATTTRANAITAAVETNIWF